MFKLTNGNTITTEEIEVLISESIKAVIDSNIPCIWYATEEPFISSYTGNVCYDYSGEVRKMTVAELEEIEKELGLSEMSSRFCESKLEELLSSVYVNQWSASYESNRGKNWISYMSKVEELFSEWKYENFELYNDETEEEDEELDMELDDILREYLRNTEHTTIYVMILEELRKE